VSDVVDSDDRRGRPDGCASNTNGDVLEADVATEVRISATAPNKEPTRVCDGITYEDGSLASDMGVLGMSVTEKAKVASGACPPLT